MDIKSEIAGAEQRIKASGLTLLAWLAQEGLPRATWYRWRNGAMPGADVWESVSAKIDRLPRVS